MVLSSINISPLSASITPLQLSYFNQDRHLKIDTAIDGSLGINLSAYNGLQSIEDISMTDNDVTFLTDRKELNEVLSDTLNQKDTLINRYYRNFLREDADYYVDVSTTDTIFTSYLLTSPLSSNINFNVVPLKVVNGVDDERVWHHNARQYKSLFFGNAQGVNYPDLFLEYKSYNIPQVIKADETVTIPLTSPIFSRPISSMGFIESGMIAGDCPLNSDVIYIQNTKNLDVNRPSLNGSPLCLWLSGESVLQGFNKQLIERWYDPNNITQGDAFISNKNTNPFGVIADIPARTNIYTDDVLTFSRLGPKRNKLFINSLSSDLLCHIDKWDSRFSDEVRGIAGFIDGSYTPSPTKELLLDGNIHAHIPPVNIMLKEYNYTTSFWMYKDDWSSGPDGQLFGNFSNFEGYGVLYATGATSNLITFPTNIGKIYGFNYRGYKIFEKDLDKNTSLTNVQIDLIATDIFGARWLYDSNNKSLLKLEADDLLRVLIQLDSNVNIVQMKVNSKNQILLLDAHTNIIKVYDTNGVFVENIFMPTANNCFEIDLDDTVVTDIANIMVCDNRNNIYKVLGSNLYKNDKVFLHIGKNIHKIKIDSLNNLWILYDYNKLLKVSDDRVLTSIDLPLSFKDTSFEMSFVKEINNKIEEDVLWIVFNNQRYILKINKDGRIIKRVFLDNVVNVRKCNPFRLTTNGEFTEFDIKRKYERFPNKKTISSTSPAFALKMNLKCGNNTELLQLFHPVNSLRGWTHFTVTHKIDNGSTIIKLYINGIEKLSYTAATIKTVNFGTKVSPFIIGGISGKLGAKNVERSVEGDYLIGRFNDLRIYNKILSIFEIKALSKNLYYDNWTDLILSVPVNMFTCIEKIKHFHKNRVPGHKSNIFNIKIHGISNVQTQAQIKTYIESLIEDIKPINTMLNEIIFE